MVNVQINLNDPLPAAKFVVSGRAGSAERNGRKGAGWNHSHLADRQPGSHVRRKLLIPILTVPVILVIDFITKRWALSALADGRSIDLLGGLLPLTLTFNKGAAFGLSVGEDSRWLFVPITFVALGMLVVLYRQASERDTLRLLALSLVAAGALGNLYDRVRWSRGVVDFFGPVDLGFWHFPIFNVADIAITCGAIGLALSFWQEEKRERQAARGDAVAPDGVAGNARIEPQG